VEDKLLAEFIRFLNTVRVLLRAPGFRGVIVCRFHVDTSKQDVKLQVEFSP
jgi:hypothetical protein